MNLNKHRQIFKYFKYTVFFIQGVASITALVLKKFNVIIYLIRKEYKIA